MIEKNKIPSIAPLYYKYPSIATENMPNVEDAILKEKGIKFKPSGKFTLFPITFKKEEIEALEVLFFHRLLNRNYGRPSDIEWEEWKRETQEAENGLHIKATGTGKEWKYYIIHDDIINCA